MYYIDVHQININSSTINIIVIMACISIYRYSIPLIFTNEIWYATYCLNFNADS